MGGQTDHRPAVAETPDSPEAALAARRRRFAMVQLAVGGPTFMILLFGLVIGFRIAGRPLGGGGAVFVVLPLVESGAVSGGDTMLAAFVLRMIGGLACSLLSVRATRLLKSLCCAVLVTMFPLPSRTDQRQHRPRRAAALTASIKCDTLHFFFFWILMSKLQKR